jgi:hypothetical protein
MKRYRFTYVVRDCQAPASSARYGVLRFHGNTYQQARARAEHQIQRMNRSKRNLDLTYTLLPPKTFADKLAPVLRWFWYLLGALIFVLLFWFVAGLFMKS